MYFTLKDEKATNISCDVFKLIIRRIKFTPENGMKVLLRGDVTVYEA